MADGSGPGPSGTRRAFSPRSILVDVTPLQASRGFRWLYLGQVGGQLARQILVVAVPYQVFIATRSSFLVGLIGLAQFLPVLICSVLGGTLADAFDRRRVLLVAQSSMAASSLGLALNAGLGGPVAPIFLMIAVNAAASAVESPSRTSIVPAVVSRDLLPSAFALNQTLNQAAQVVGPALAGVLMAQLGVWVVYVISAAAGVFSVLCLLPLGPQRPVGATGRVTVGATVEGWRYVRRRPLLQQTMLIDLNAMLFGMPRALFPVIGVVVLGGDAATVGLLHAAPGVGALIGALTTGWVASVLRQGRVIILAISVWSVAIIVFGLVRQLWVGLVMLAIAGAADVISTVFRNAILQTAVPDGLRGRVTAFKSALSTGGPQLGDAESGAVAEVTSPVFSVVSGGVASLVGTLLLGFRERSLWNHVVTGEQLDPDEVGAGLPTGST